MQHWAFTPKFLRRANHKKRRGGTASSPVHRRRTGNATAHKQIILYENATFLNVPDVLSPHLHIGAFLLVRPNLLPSAKVLQEEEDEEEEEEMWTTKIAVQAIGDEIRWGGCMALDPNGVGERDSQ